MMTCYAHLEQHSSCSLEWYRTTRPATPDEYASLKAELEAKPYEYKLIVHQRISKEMQARFASNLDRIQKGGEGMINHPTTSAFDLLPSEVQASILGGSKQHRDDLRLIRSAEAAGWTVTFRDGRWHNAASFKKDGVAVWSTAHDWRAARLENDRYGESRLFAYSESGLRAALGLPEA